MSVKLFKNTVSSLILSNEHRQILFNDCVCDSISWYTFAISGRIFELKIARTSPVRALP